MKKFITYFDLLGFGDFIRNNNTSYQHEIMNSIFRDIERSLSKASGGNFIEVEGGVINDIRQSKINAINFSDTIVFWTIDDTKKSLLELLEVTLSFNILSVVHSFPSRGALVFEEIFHVPYLQKNENSAIYNTNSVYGKGLLLAHDKAESQKWAGTVVDESCVTRMLEIGLDIEEVLKPFCLYHHVPYKEKKMMEKAEYAFKIVHNPIDEARFQGYKKTIGANFANHNKKLSSNAQEILNNTLIFLERFKI